MRKKKKTETGDGAVKNPMRRRLNLEEEASDGGVGGNPLLVRCRLNLDNTKVGSGTSLDCFSRATLMDRGGNETNANRFWILIFLLDANRDSNILRYEYKKSKSDSNSHLDIYSIYMSII